MRDIESDDELESQALVRALDYDFGDDLYDELYNAGDEFLDDLLDFDISPSLLEGFEPKTTKNNNNNNNNHPAVIFNTPQTQSPTLKLEEREPINFNPILNGSNNIFFPGENNAILFNNDPPIFNDANVDSVFSNSKSPFSQGFSPTRTENLIEPTIPLKPNNNYEINSNPPPIIFQSPLSTNPLPTQLVTPVQPQQHSQNNNPLPMQAQPVQSRPPIIQHQPQQQQPLQQQQPPLQHLQQPLLHLQQPHQQQPPPVFLNLPSNTHIPPMRQLNPQSTLINQSTPFFNNLPVGNNNNNFLNGTSQNGKKEELLFPQNVPTSLRLSPNFSPAPKTNKSTKNQNPSVERIFRTEKIQNSRTFRIYCLENNFTYDLTTSSHDLYKERIYEESFVSLLLRDNHVPSNLYFSYEKVPPVGCIYILQSTGDRKPPPCGDLKWKCHTVTKPSSSSNEKHYGEWRFNIPGLRHSYKCKVIEWQLNSKITRMYHHYI